MPIFVRYKDQLFWRAVSAVSDDWKLHTWVSGVGFVCDCMPNHKNHLIDHEWLNGLKWDSEMAVHNSWWKLNLKFGTQRGWLTDHGHCRLKTFLCWSERMFNASNAVIHYKTLKNCNGPLNRLCNTIWYMMTMRKAVKNIVYAALRWRAKIPFICNCPKTFNLLIG